MIYSRIKKLPTGLMYRSDAVIISASDLYRVAEIATHIATTEEIPFRPSEHNYQYMQMMFWFAAFERYLFERGLQGLQFKLDLKGEHKYDKKEKERVGEVESEEACPYCGHHATKAGDEVRPTENKDGAVIDRSGGSDSGSPDARRDQVRGQQLASGDEVVKAHRCRPKTPK